MQMVVRDYPELRAKAEGPSIQRKVAAPQLKGKKKRPGLELWPRSLHLSIGFRGMESVRAL